MAPFDSTLHREPNGIPVPNLDFSTLVGREIRMFTEQVPGKEILVRVVSTHDGQFVLDSGPKWDMLNNLVHSQTVVLQVAYKGQQLSIKAQFKRTAGGRHVLMLDQTVTPLSHRRFVRIELIRPVKLAAVPMSSFVRKNLSRLRWLETNLRNFSSGGASVTLPGQLETGVFMLAAIEVEEPGFPPLILSQIRHSYPIENGQFMTGMEFIIREKYKALVPASTARELPSVVQSYEARHREALNKHLMARTPSDTNTSN
ncbi:MAG TPA: hypothetical protein VMS71_03905 [Candidatus Acidoferrum sp.]|nr:hypothetical protein [Candidatus Acidoferrum sp.]